MYKEVAIMWKNKEKFCRLRWCIWFVNNKACYFTKIVAPDFRYDPRKLLSVRFSLDELHFGQDPWLMLCCKFHLSCNIQLHEKTVTRFDI